MCIFKYLFRMMGFKRIAMDSEEIVRHMFSDLYSYKENISELLVRYFDANPDIKASWADWFEGK